MKKHLTLKDDKNDKFWNIKTSGSSFTVTHGNAGIDGGEDFSTEEECLAEAGKLVDEKIKEGYVTEQIEFDHPHLNQQKWFSGIDAHITSFDKINDLISSKADYLSDHYRFYSREAGDLEINITQFKDVFEQSTSETYPLADYGSSIINSCIKRGKMLYEVEVPVEVGIYFALFFNRWIRKCISKEDVIHLIIMNNSLPVKGHGIFKFLVMPTEIINRYEWKDSTERVNEIVAELSINLDLMDCYFWDECLSNMLTLAKRELKKTENELLFLTNNWISLFSKSIDDEDDVEFGIPGRPGNGSILHWVY